MVYFYGTIRFLSVQVGLGIERQRETLYRPLRVPLATIDPNWEDQFLSFNNAIPIVTHKQDPWRFGPCRFLRLKCCNARVRS